MRLKISGMRGAAIAAALAFTVALPAVAFAQTGTDNPVPEDARTLLPESRWTELYCLEARWQVEAAHQSIDDIEDTLASIDAHLGAINARAELPDFAAMRARLDVEVAAVCGAETARAARDAAAALAARIREQVREPLDQLSLRLRERLQAACDAMQEQIRTSVNSYFASERATHEVRLQQEFEAQVNSRLSQLGREPTQADRDAAAVSARAYVRQLAEQIEISVRTQAQLLAEQLRVDSETKLRAAANEINNLAERQRNRTATALSATAQTHLNNALRARKDAVLVVVDWRIEQLRTRLQQRMLGLPDDRIREVQTVLDDIAVDRNLLEQNLDTAISTNNRSGFQNAVESFQQKWQERETDFEQTRVAATIRCEVQADGIEAALRAASRLRNGLPDNANLPAAYRERITAIRASLDDLDSAVAEFQAACQAGESTGAEILALVERVRQHASEANGEVAALRAAAGGARR